MKDYLAQRLVEEIKLIEEDVRVEKINKNGVQLTGFLIGSGDIIPIVYLENFIQDFNGVYRELALKMVNIAHEGMKKASVFNKEITTWNYAKENLRLCIAPNGIDDEFVTYPYLDLELYVRVLLDRKENVSFKVSKQLLQYWNITKETLLHAAYDCTYPTHTIIDLVKIFGGSGISEKIIALTSKENEYGASVLYNKWMLKKLADEYEDDLLIIPSSIHEIIVVPATDMDANEMMDIICQVNKSVLYPEEILSNHPYIFHRNTMEITW